MPFIEGEKLAKLYKEIDDERNASSYFRELHQSTKRNAQHIKADLGKSKTFSISFVLNASVR